MPADLPAAVLVVIHLSPNTGLAAAARRRRRQPVAGRVRGGRNAAADGHRPAVDPLFRSAGHLYGPRVIGMVLSGTLDCGTMGLAVVKNRGGVAVVQDPRDAEWSDMPESAIANVAVDHIVSLDDMGALLSALTRQPPDAAPASAPPLVAGTPSGLTCPACAGALWEQGEANLAGFLCHTGHRYSIGGLEADQERMVDGALYAAIRALAEKAALHRLMAQRAREHGRPEANKRFEEQARHTERQANALRKLLTLPRTTDEEPAAG